MLLSECRFDTQRLAGYPPASGILLANRKANATGPGEKVYSYDSVAVMKYQVQNQPPHSLSGTNHRADSDIKCHSEVA